MSIRVTSLRALAGVALVAGSAGTALAGTVVVDTTPGIDLIGPFTTGWSFSQTFLAQGTNLASFGVDVRGRDAMFRGFVFATDPLDPLRHTPVGPAIYTSPAVQLLTARGVVTFTTGGLAVNPGDWYAVGIEYLTMGSDIVYMYAVDGGDGAAGTGFSNSRTVPLGIPDTWTGLDWAFRVTMDDGSAPASVPLPSAALLGLGLFAGGGVLTWARSRRNSSQQT